MKAVLRTICALAACVLVVWGCAAPTSSPSASGAAAGKAQITVLYDAFGKATALQKDWGYAALIEYDGKRILFDTGNNGETLARNARAKGVDLAQLDFVVLSHRHGDHMRFGAAWPDANFQLVDKSTEIAPGIHLIALVSDKPGTLELRELSLVLNTPDGAVVVVGCAHPGIDRVM